MAELIALMGTAAAGASSAAAAAGSAVASAAPALQLAGTIASAVGGVAAAGANKAASKAAADEQDRAATEARAVAQRKEYEERRKTDYAQSRLRAVAAASGGGTGGTVLDLAADIGAQGQYNRDVAMYEGDSRAAKYKTKAAMTRLQGKTDYTGSLFSTAGNLAGGLYKYSQSRG